MCRNFIKEGLGRSRDGLRVNGDAYGEAEHALTYSRWSLICSAARHKVMKC